MYVIACSPLPAEDANQSPSFSKCQPDCSHKDCKHLEPQKFRTPRTCLRNQLRTDSSQNIGKDSFETLVPPDRDNPRTWKESFVRVPKLYPCDELDLCF